MALKRISDIVPEQVRRANTGYDSLDWLYGCSTFPSGEVKWGIPQSKISLWCGKGGVGKSRTAIALARTMSSVMKVLYFQNEADLSTFAGWVKNNRNLPNFYCSDNTDLKSQISHIKKVAPQLVIVDSINQLEEFGSGDKTRIKNIIEGYDNIEGYRDIVKSMKCHMILLCQLNKDGSIKGSTTLEHLADITLILEGGNGLFTIKVGEKNRCGRTGKEFVTIWRHTAVGVECRSDWHLEDKLWCRTHNIPVRDLKAHFGLTPAKIKRLQSIDPKKRSRRKTVAPVVAPQERISLFDRILLGGAAGFAGFKYGSR